MANRGKIQELVVFNFKSFAGKHKIGPFLEFTAVVGPNGGGKSNIMDAVSFVLGVRSSDLRASNLKDLIYRKESEKSTDITRTCYVKLKFSTADSTELTFKRTISSSGTSDYSINKVKENIEKYQKVLLGLNIIVNAKNFLIFQGQVDALAMKSGKDLTSLFEKISGSDEMKQEYEASKIEVDVCEENLKSINAKISFFASEKKKLKEQKAQALNYDNLVGKIKDLHSNFYMLQFVGIERELENKKKNLQEKGKELDGLRQEKERCILGLRESNISLKQLEQKLINVNDDVSGKTNLLRNKRPEITKIQETIKQFDNRIAAKTQNMQKIQLEIEKETKRYEALMNEQAIFDEEIANKQKLLEEDLKISINDNKKSVFLQLKKEFGIKAFAEKKELERLKKEQTTKEINIGLVSQQLKEKSAEKEKIDGEIENIEKNLQEKEEDMESTEKVLEKAIRDLTIVSQEHAHLKEKEGEYMKKLELLDSKIREYKVVEACKYDREKEKSVVEDMIRHRKTVKGLLGDLLTPIQPKYSTAVKASLGGILDYLVVDDVETAQYVHQKLRDHGIVKEVLVLENIPETRISESLRHLVSAHGCLLSDVITHDKNYGLDKALALLVGNKALAETLENANSLRQVRGIKLIVTLDGVCIKNGMISSAPKAKRSEKVSQKKIQIEKEAEEARSEMQKIQKVLHGENTVGDTKIHIENLKNSLGGLKNGVRILTVHLETLGKRRKEVNSVVQGLKIQMDALTVQYEKTKSDVAILEISIQAIEDAIFKNFCREMGINSIKSLDGRDLDEENQIQATINSLKKESTRISWVAKSINLQGLKENFVQVKESMGKDQKELEKMQGKLENLTQEFENLTETSTGLKNQEKNLKTQISQQKDQQTSIQNTYETIVKACSKAEKENSNEERAFEHLIQQKNQKLEELFVKNLEVPIKIQDGTKDIDFSVLDSRFKKMSPSEIEKESEEISKQIEKESKTLENLIGQGKCTFQQEKFSEIEGKLDEANKQMEYFDRLNKDAKARFLQVKERRRACFMSTFDHVANNISGIYKEMTKTAKNFYYGGNALLYVDNTEEPYNGGVIYSPTPPCKRCMYEMDQLSGGEKTIAALSLLFAIHSAIPSPFYIMDEVDAFLDWENCQLLLNYLQKVSEEQSQCIIITHKEEFFSNADNLIGTTYIPCENTSKSFSFDLRTYGPKQLAIV